VPKPLDIRNWVDAPDFHQRKSNFDGNDLGILGNVEALPTTEEEVMIWNKILQLKEFADDEKVHLEAKKIFKC
jgi:hypothetical protein